MKTILVTFTFIAFSIYQILIIWAILHHWLSNIRRQIINYLLSDETWDQQDQIWIIETKIENFWVSMTRLRPKLKRFESQWLDWDWEVVNLNEETKTEKVWVQWWDWDQDWDRVYGWKYLSLNDGAETGQKMLNPRFYQDSCWYLPD